MSAPRQPVELGKSPDGAARRPSAQGGDIGSPRRTSGGRAPIALVALLAHRRDRLVKTPLVVVVVGIEPLGVDLGEAAAVAVECRDLAGEGRQRRTMTSQ